MFGSELSQIGHGLCALLVVCFAVSWVLFAVPLAQRVLCADGVLGGCCGLFLVVVHRCLVHRLTFG